MIIVSTTGWLTKTAVQLLVDNYRSIPKLQKHIFFHMERKKRAVTFGGCVLISIFSIPTFLVITGSKHQWPSEISRWKKVALCAFVFTMYTILSNAAAELDISNKNDIQSKHDHLRDYAKGGVDDLRITDLKRKSAQKRVAYILEKRPQFINHFHENGFLIRDYENNPVHFDKNGNPIFDNFPNFDEAELTSINEINYLYDEVYLEANNEQNNHNDQQLFTIQSKND